MDLNTLRSITHRLNSTPVHDLPNISFYLSTAVRRCLDSVQSPRSKDVNDRASWIHKLKTKIGSLLQDRSAAGRLAGAILAKSFIEAPRTVSSSVFESWSRTLLGNLSKKDSPAQIRLYVLVLTRIYVLANDEATLRREVTTNLLPSFVDITLKLVQPKVVKNDKLEVVVLSYLIEPILSSWTTILPLNPAIFRPFVNKIRATCIYLLCSESKSQLVVSASCRMLCVLPQSSSKNIQAEVVGFCNDTMESIHKLTDQIFDGVREPWVSASMSSLGSTEATSRSSREHEPVLAPLIRCKDRHQAVQRLEHSFELLRHLLDFSAVPWTLPIASILNMLDRLSMLAESFYDETTDQPVELDVEIPLSERDALYLMMIKVSVAAVRFEYTLVDILQHVLVPVWRNIWEHASSFFLACQHDFQSRTEVYELLYRVVLVVGPALGGDEVDTVLSLISKCCEDLSTTLLPGSDWYQHSSTSLIPPTTKCQNLIGSVLNSIPTASLPHLLRTEIDRVAVLVNSHDLLLASTLNPPSQLGARTATPSLLPFLAQHAKQSLGSEALLRPRMPFISTMSVTLNGLAEGSEGDDASDRPVQDIDDDGLHVEDHDEGDVQDSKSADDESRADVDISSKDNTNGTSDFMPLKREYQLMSGEGGTAPTFRSSPHMEMTHPVVGASAKRPRIDEVAAEDVGAIAGDEGSALSKPRWSLRSEGGFISNGQTPRLHDHQTRPVTGPGAVSYQSPQKELRSDMNEENSSDSEIPEIDIEPDTDDEDIQDMA